MYIYATGCVKIDNKAYNEYHFFTFVESFNVYLLLCVMTKQEYQSRNAMTGF